MIYLASPYTHPNHNVEIWRYQAAARIAAKYMELGILIYSPIVHGYGIATVTGTKGDWLTWRRHSEAMIRICSSVLVLQLPDWHESVGIAAEIKFAKSIGKDIGYISHDSDSTD